jgi:hypothetical protein
VKIEQVVTLTLTADECREYCVQLGEAESIIQADPLDHGNTRTGLTVLRDLRDLFEKHGLGAGRHPEYPPAPQLWSPYGPPPQGYPPPYYVPPPAPSYRPDPAAWMQGREDDDD